STSYEMRMAQSESIGIDDHPNYIITNGGGVGSSEVDSSGACGGGVGGNDCSIELGSPASSTTPRGSSITKTHFSKPNDDTQYPYSPQFSDTTFSILVAVVCIYSLAYSFIVGPFSILFAFIISLIVITTYTLVCSAKHNKWYILWMTVLSIALGLCIPSFFEATGKVVIHLQLSTWDQTLLDTDSSLMGWLFPMGQMGLYIDKSDRLGPDSFIGSLSTEVFQLSYISYYIWGYSMEIYLIYNLWRCYLSKDIEKRRRMPIWDQLLKMFIVTWISTYFIVFSINLMVPAVSPRVYLQGEYVNSLKGFGLAGIIRSKIDNAAQGSFGSFPSGHIATSWAVAFASYKIVPVYGIVSGFAAFLITIATMYLRYHYMVDFLGAMPVSIFCIFFGGFYSISDVIRHTKRALLLLRSRLVVDGSGQQDEETES
ncbi:hypothetical protein SAMD00019534_057100, partial [Acytostelium subglobosum LB1]|uniref:hypothetical protein n=1 Tax=Acytostelium subglobosum LB1 TaxID=1410327 RepID=UPI0006448870